jgi:uncharacterized protein
VTLPATNVWLALVLSKHDFHSAASAWFEQQTEEGSVAFCRSTSQSLVRLLSTAAMMNAYGLPAMSNEKAWKVYQDLLTDRRVTFAVEAADIESRWGQLAARATSSPKLWMDAYLAAFCASSGMTCVTTDGAFHQFKPLRLILLKSDR